jgi:hypothetical protein
LQREIGFEIGYAEKGAGGITSDTKGSEGGDGWEEEEDGEKLHGGRLRLIL